MFGLASENKKYLNFTGQKCLLDDKYQLFCVFFFSYVWFGESKLSTWINCWLHSITKSHLNKRFGDAICIKLHS